MSACWNAYQNDAAQTAVYPGRLGLVNNGNNPNGLIYTALGLSGEAGELLEAYTVGSPELFKELGDVLWYVSQMAMELGIPLSVIASVKDDERTKQLHQNITALVISAGAVADIVKKVLRDNNGHVKTSTRAAIVTELRHIIIAAEDICRLHQKPIEDVCHENTEKLMSRMSRGKLGGSGNDR